MRCTHFEAFVFYTLLVTSAERHLNIVKYLKRQSLVALLDLRMWENVFFLTRFWLNFWCVHWLPLLLDVRWTCLPDCNHNTDSGSHPASCRVIGLPGVEKAELEANHAHLVPSSGMGGVLPLLCHTSWRAVIKHW